MRKHIVAGNWKMNLTLQEGVDLANSVRNLASATLPNTSPNTLPTNLHIVFCTPFIHLNEVLKTTDKVNYFLGAQNCHTETSGAYTGETSVEMLKSVGVDYVIIGHSERREYFHEDSVFLAKKVDTVLSAHLTPLFCCGESQKMREEGDYIAFVKQQLTEGLFHLGAEAIKQVVIAYEPIWAIGTGLTASAGQAQEMHAALRAHLSEKYGKEVAQEISILYGGSVKPSNASEIFAGEDVDGGLVGGASLKAEDFIGIIKAFV